MFLRNRKKLDILKIYSKLKGKKIFIETGVKKLTKNNLRIIYTPGVGKVASFLGKHKKELKKLPQRKQQTIQDNDTVHKKGLIQGVFLVVDKNKINIQKYNIKLKNK